MVLGNMKLLENGLDSFGKSLTKLFELEKGQEKVDEFVLKDILLSFHHSLETLFKFLISEKNEYLIYEHLKNIFENRSLNLNCDHSENTITFLDAYNRVIVLYSEKSINKVYEALKTLNTIRNGLTHHEIDLDIREVENIIAIILSWVLGIFSKYIKNFRDFLKDHKIDSNVKDLYSRNQAWEISTLIEGLNSLKSAKIKLSDINSDNIKRKKLSEQILSENKKLSLSICPICNGKYFFEKGTVIEDSNIIENYSECLFCGFSLMRDILILKHTSYLEYDNISDFIIGRLKNALYDYSHDNKAMVEEPVKKIIRNPNAFKEFYYNTLRSEISDILCFIEDNLEVTLNYNSEDDVTMYLMKAIDNISCDNRVRFLDLCADLRILLNFFNKCFEADPDGIKNEFQFNQNTLLLAYSDVLNIYQNWKAKKNSENSFYTFIRDHRCYDKILDDILYETSDGDIWTSLAGSPACDYGTVDRVTADYGDLDYIYEVIKNDDVVILKCIFEVFIGTECYYDHEFFGNGSTEIYVKGNIIYDKNEDDLKLDDILLIG